MHGHDRCRSRQQRRQGISRPGRQIRAAHPHASSSPFSRVLLLGIAFLVRAYHIGATDPGSPGYQSVLSMLLAAVTGRGWFYWVSISSIMLVLALSANTAFADFPRLCRVIAQNGYLPYTFSLRGPPPGLFTRHLRARGPGRNSAHDVRRRHGPADSALRRRRVPGFHALPDRHGFALAQVVRIPERSTTWL